MSTILKEQYAGNPETNVYAAETGNRKVNRILLGTWAGMIEDNGNDRVKVVTAGPDGWIERNELRDSMCLKVFYIDVQQGDGILIEAPGKRILIDGGPNSNVKRYLKGYQYRYLLDSNQKVKIDTMFVSHFDADHYRGLISLLNDSDFEFDEIFHNGIARFDKARSKRPHDYNSDLGNVADDVLKTTFGSVP